MTEFSEAMFKHFKSDPHAWWVNATQCHGAAQLVAYALDPMHAFALAQSGALPEASTFAGNGRALVDFLRGLSLELAYKALSVARRNSVEPVHKLTQLAVDLSLSLTTDQRTQLTYYEAAVVWMGRYPVTKKPEEFIRFHDLLHEGQFGTSDAASPSARSPALLPPTGADYRALWQLAVDAYTATLPEPTPPCPVPPDYE